MRGAHEQRVGLWARGGNKDSDAGVCIGRVTCMYGENLIVQVAWYGAAGISLFYNESGMSTMHDRLGWGSRGPVD